MAKKALLFLLIIVITLSSCGVNEPIIQEEKEVSEQKYTGDNNLYIIDVDLDPHNKMLHCKQRVEYINRESVDLDKLYFHIYPNAFSREDILPIFTEDLNTAYPNGFEEGYIDIVDISIENERINYRIIGETNTVLEVTPSVPIKVGEGISIDFEYIIKLPPLKERFGYNDLTINLGNWYPILAVYDDREGWNLDPYYPIGDPFFSDVSDYVVRIVTPKNFTVAATGEIEKIYKDDTIEWNIKAEKVRDFAWVVSDKFEVLEEEVEGINIKGYFLNTTDMHVREEAMKITSDSIRIFNKIFGKYPYKTYSVVETKFPSGMEYPQIVFIGDQYYEKDFIPYLEGVIVHETAHQWWYGVVGNNQVDEPWLDESLTGYSEVIYYREKYGEEVGLAYHNQKNLAIFNRADGQVKEKPVAIGLKDFQDWLDYGFLIYTKGTLFFEELEREYGRELFYDILRTYYERYKFDIAYSEDFFSLCEEILQEDISPLIDKWLR